MDREAGGVEGGRRGVRAQIELAPGVFTPGTSDVGAFADQLLWLRQDMRDPDLNRMARERFRLLREAIAQRLPLMTVAPADAARLVEAQWQGALTQWGIAPEGRLIDFVTESLTVWFELVGVRV